MKRHVDALVRNALSDVIEEGLLRIPRLPAYGVEVPRHAAYGDLACDVALALGRQLGRPPEGLATMLAVRLRERHGAIAGVEVAGPGYINFRFTLPFWCARLAEAEQAGDTYGRSDSGRGRRACVVVANTDRAGPLTAGTVRRGAVADAAARLLEATGWMVDRALPASAPDQLVGVVGAGRSGDVARVRGILASLGTGAAALRVLPVGPARMNRDGQPVAGDAAPAIAELGGDARAFLSLLARSENPLDFDLELARRRSTDNPLFYVQYAHARLAGVLRTVDVAPANDPLALGMTDRDALRGVAAWPDVVEEAGRSLEPSRMACFAIEVAAVAHRWLNRRPSLVPARVALARSLRGVLAGALALSGATAPEQMEEG